MFVYFDGDGQTVVSKTAIRPHEGAPQRLGAFDAQDAVRLTGWSWKDEHCYVQLERPEEYEQFCRALDAKVWRDMYRDPRCMN
jgi:hypothetical protein